ncbi:MAG: hypothetical protein AAF639_32760 [Chloroflexota bacterium]
MIDLTQIFGKENDCGEDSLAALISEIQRSPINPNNIHPPTADLSTQFLNPVTKPDPDFDSEAWLNLWDSYEAEMKKAARADEVRTLMDMALTLPAESAKVSSRHQLQPA